MNRWYRVDNVAKLFTSVTGTKNSSVFRISAVLKEDIDKDILQKAIEHIYERFPTLFVKLRHGLFWNYFENTSDKFLVEEEHEYPCAAIDSKIKDGYLTKVFYFNKRISVEMFHGLADGNGGMEFLKTLLFYYLKFKGEEVSSDNLLKTVEEGVWNHELEDSFNRYFKKTSEKYKKNKRAFRIKGDLFEVRGNNIITGILDIEHLKSVSAGEGYGLTTYLISVLAYSIYLTRVRFSNSKKPVVIAVPVNLRGMFKSETLRNFFGVVNVTIDNGIHDTFEKILEEVNQQLKLKTSEEYLQKVVADNLKVAKSKYSRLVPLFIKSKLVRLGFALFGEERKTITLSNMGIVSLPESMKKHIILFETILYPTAKSPINCCICTYNNQMIINFSRAIEDNDIIKQFVHFFDEKGVNSKMYSNNWGKVPVFPDENKYDSEAVEYPDYTEAYKISKKLSFLKIVLFITICLGVILTLTNIFTYEKYSHLWSIFADIVMFSVWIILLVTFSKRILVGGKILIYFWILAVAFFLLDIFTGFNKWSTTYIIPFMTVAITFVITLVAIARRKLYKEYMGYLLMAIFTGICPILLFAFSLSDKLWTCIVAVVYSVLTLVGLLIFSDRSFRKEIIKRFHY